MRPYIKLLRIKHYVKNVLVLMPLFFSGQFSQLSLLKRAGWGFLAFCAISSAVYVINDLRDAEQDRQHPTKKNRPIASGAVGKKTAVLIAAGLVLAALCFNVPAGGHALLPVSVPRAWHAFLPAALLVGYLLINVAYSAGLKNVPILDIAILVAGFLIRMFYGAVITGIAVSEWLYLTVLAGAFYFGLGKRRNELVRQENGGETRKVLRFYNQSFLDKNMYMCLALTIAFYSLWAIGSERSAMVWTVPLIILICMRYSLDVEGNSDGDPVEVVFGDRALLALVAVFCVLTAALVYFA